MFSILFKEISQLVPRNQILRLALAHKLRIAAVVEVAMGGSRDDEQLLVGRIGIGLANHVVALGLAIHHIVIGSLAEVA